MAEAPVPSSPVERSLRVLRWMFGVLVVLIACWFLRWSYVVAMPLATAIFVTALVWPLYRLMRRTLPRWLRWVALPASMGTVLVFAAIFLGAIWYAITLAFDRAPQYVQALQETWQGVAAWAAARGLPADRIDMSQAGAQAIAILRTHAMTGVNSVASLAAYAVLVFFFTAMMLSESRRWAERTREALPDGRAAGVVDVARTIGRKARMYLLTQTCVSLLSGVLQGMYVWLMGVEMAIVWGMLFFLLNYIPNIGSTIAMIPPTLLTLMTAGPAWAGLLLVGLIVIETMIGYGVQPWLVGRSLTISPLVALLAVVFWGWLWGAIGAVLAVPLTVTAIVAAAHIPSLRPIAMLLSDVKDDQDLHKQTHAT